MKFWTKLRMLDETQYSHSHNFIQYVLFDILKFKSSIHSIIQNGGHSHTFSVAWVGKFWWRKTPQRENKKMCEAENREGILLQHHNRVKDRRSDWVSRNVQNECDRLWVHIDSNFWSNFFPRLTSLSSCLWPSLLIFLWHATDYWHSNVSKNVRNTLQRICFTLNAMIKNQMFDETAFKCIQHENLVWWTRKCWTKSLIENKLHQTSSFFFFYEFFNLSNKSNISSIIEKL